MAKSTQKTVDDVFRDALGLDDAEREQLLMKLTAEASSAAFATPEVRTAWAEECDRRYQEWREGEVKAVPGDVVLQRLRERLAK